MRKVLLTALALGFGVAQAQHWVLNTIMAGENPGGLNTDVEQTSGILSGLGGYTQLLTPASTGWSTQQTIPFTFSFNGNDYTQYYAAATGVVTFSSSVGTAPSTSNVALPSSEIPDNSICAWGISLAGVNDAVMAKTFGTAPNRQHWVIWSSASAPELTGTNWTYWGIVMEETTNKVYVVDMRTYSSTSTNVSLSVGLQYDGSTAVSVNTSPNTTSTTTATSGNGDDASDNTYYMFTPGTQPAVDIHMVDADLSKYIAVGQTGQITGRIRNLGSNAISSFDVEWTDGTNTFTTTVAGNVNSGSYKAFTCADQVDPGPSGLTTVTVTGVIAGDADASNDSKTLTCSEMAFIPHKVVLGEEATGTWCGWCPRGAVWMETMEEEHGADWVGIAVHNADPMTVTAYDSWMGSMVSGYPSGVVDRKAVMDPSDFGTGFDAATEEFAVADILVLPTIDGSRNVEVNIQAHFAVAPADELRLAAIVVENGVTGTTAGYNQANYYAGGASGQLSGAGHDWHTSPNPVPASQMVYNEVGRQLLGGIDGDASSVPSSTGAGEYVHYQYSFTLDNAFDADNVFIAAILIENSTGYVLNAGENHLGANTTAEGDDAIEVGGTTYVMYNNAWTDVSTLENINGTWYPLGTKAIVATNISVYPKPASSVLNIRGVEGSTSVVIYDVRGAVVMNTVIEGNSVDIQSLNAGIYNVQISNNGLTATERITVIK